MRRDFQFAHGVWLVRMLTAYNPIRPTCRYKIPNMPTHQIYDCHLINTACFMVLQTSQAACYINIWWGENEH